jgi:hypothetical protein
LFSKIKVFKLKLRITSLTRLSSLGVTEVNPDMNILG